MIQFGGFFRTYRIASLLLLLFLVLISSPFELFAADGADKIMLDADKISFEESTGVAKAEGNVRIDNKEVRLFAPYVEYDSGSQQVKAYSSPEGSVTFLTAGRRLSGEKLDYNIITRQGTLTHPSGKIDEFYVKGDSLRIEPTGKPTKPREKTEDTQGDTVSEEDMAAFWDRALLTTCEEPNPHYRLEAKSVTVVPGKSIVVKKPRVYLGGTLIASYPFDYYVPLDEKDKRQARSLFPKIGYESSKGAGLGVSGAYGWQSGMIGMEIIGWTDGIFEGDAQLLQDIGRDFTLRGNLRRQYDKDRDDTLWRPAWALEYATPSGWRFDIEWSQRELVSVKKRAGQDTRYVVWKEPEFMAVSPWFSDRGSGGFYRFFGSWGRYEDATHGRSPKVERMGVGAQVYGEFKNNKERYRPFYNAIYWYYDYDSDISDRQELLDAVLGVRWKMGDLDMETAYLRRWSWGYSPMGWDDYEDREDIYQQISYRIPTKSRKISWVAGIRAAYSIKEKELDEMVYKVAYDQHCLLWEAIYRDDRHGDDDWFGLSLTIKAYPESGVRLSGSDLFDPAKAPDDLAPHFD